MEGPFDRHPGVDSPSSAEGARMSIRPSTSFVPKFATETVTGTHVPGGTVTL